jgi:phage terminase large subunit-like protein
MEQAALIKKLGSSFWFRLYLMNSLPAAFFSGLRVQSLSTSSAVVTIKYSWFSKNPFKSIYFACLGMAAEMSSGILALTHTQHRRPRISMLVLNMQASFHKKAVGKIRFECHDGDKISDAIEKAVSTKEGIICETTSKGYDEQDRCVAEFNITWTFKETSK